LGKTKKKIKADNLGKIDLMQDEQYLRRIKKVNYGKWFLKPDNYEDKNKKFKVELDKHNVY